jgi:two-component system, NtrC family, C4-dicarboxylate transport response regulator DctD
MGSEAPETAHVLVVDDEAVLRRLVKRALASADISVTEAANGIEALELCRAHEFSAVVSDIRMPLMDGRELVAELQRLDPGLPVILVSGSDEVATPQAARELGAFDFLQKPFVLFDLARRTLAAIASRTRLTVENREVA